MAASRIAGLFAAALLSLQLSAQQAPQAKITIQVVDPTGAVVRGARIEIDPPSGAVPNFAKADGSGEVVLNLPAGKHVLRISSSGFRTSVQPVSIEGDSDRTVKVTLQFGAMGPGYSGPCCWFYALEAWNRVESVQLPDTMPLRPVANLAPLPSRPIKECP